MQADQKKMPLVAAMLKYKKEQVYPFHTPGHKGGRGMEPLLAGELGAGALQMDVSLMAELDDIHCPEGCIAAAQTWPHSFTAATAVFLLLTVRRRPFRQC